MSTAAVTLLLVASMLAVGTSTGLDEFRALTRRRVMVTVALAVNVVVLPGLAVALVTVTGLRPEAALGVIIAAAAPGGATGALLTLRARGDAAVSAGLQVLLGPLGLIAVPVWVAAAGHGAIGSGDDALLVVGGGLLGQVAPLAVGIWLRRTRPQAAERLHRISRRIADLLLLVLVLYFLITGISRLPQVGWAGVAVIVALVTASLTPAVISALGSATERRAVAMTTGVRNLTLALFFATASSPAVVLALLAYGLIMYGLCIPAAWTLARSPAPSTRRC